MPDILGDCTCLRKRQKDIMLDALNAYREDLEKEPKRFSPLRTVIEIDKDRAISMIKLIEKIPLCKT